MIQKISDEDVLQFRSSDEFDEEWYLAQYPDVAQTGMDPAYHYLWIGSKLGRQSSPNQKIDGGASSSVEVSADSTAEVTFENDSPSHYDSEVYEVIAAEFSSDFYLTAYPDVALAKVDPVAHYITNGWKEGRDPSIWFSTRYYLETYPDIAAAGVNPFHHFLAMGRQEGRQAVHQLGFRYDILKNLKSVKAQIEEVKSRRGPVAIGNDFMLGIAIEQASRAGSVMLSFSHDNFTQHVGGIQLLLRRELDHLREKNWSQVHIFPAHPLLFLDCSGEIVTLGVLVNGEFIGYYSPKIVSTAIKCLSDIPAHRRSFVVHSLLGMNVDQIIDIINAAGIEEGYFWLHDYAALYNNYKLLRNDLHYCGIPRPGTWAFDLCEFAKADFSQPEEFQKLFRRFAVNLISPSQAALDIWRETGLHRLASEHVLAHCELIERPVEISARADTIPLKVGYLGYPADHKGWSVYRELVRKFQHDSRYMFFHFGQNRLGGLPVTFVEVVGGKDNPDGMRQAVEDHELDVAITWSIWPETFCLIAYEALAGGAALIANPDGGNIAALVAGTGAGKILADEKALAQTFSTGDILALSRRNRAVRKYSMKYSEMTATFTEMAK